MRFIWPPKPVPLTLWLYSLCWLPRLKPKTSNSHPPWQIAQPGPCFSHSLQHGAIPVNQCGIACLVAAALVLLLLCLKCVAVSCYENLESAQVLVPLCLSSTTLSPTTWDNLSSFLCPSDSPQYDPVHSDWFTSHVEDTSSAVFLFASLHPRVWLRACAS